MPDTYFEFAVGYLLLWTLLFAALGWGLCKVQKQEKLLKELEKSVK